MRECTNCGVVKSETEFTLQRARGRTYRSSWCRTCKNEQCAARVRRLRDRCRAIVWGHLAANPCVDCGEADPVVLEFDHVRGEKVADVSQLMRRRNVGRLLAEIAKCDVVCANCHRRRTAARAGWSKAIDELTT
jgi:hypothetical protein